MSNVIECLKERGLIDALTSEEFVKRANEPLKIYVGFDPTADSLHIGNLVGIVVLKWFQMYGHIPVVVLGGATGRIGDPSGKSMERPLLDDATIQYNVARIRRHFEAVLDFFHPTARPIVVNNDQWYSKFSLVDFLRDVGKHFRIGTMLAKESVRSRLQSEDGMSFTEFSYQLLQAYDFVHLHKEHGVEVQAGGSDQWGNITAGIELVRKLSAKPAYGLTWPLLTRSDGKKFGKTEDGAIWLAADRCSPYQFYQYFVRVPDADVIKMMQMLTFMEMNEIREYEAMLGKTDYVPNTAQRRLAEELTRLIHGEDGLQVALKVTESAAPGAKAALDAESFRAISQDMPNTVLKFDEVVGHKFTEVAARIGLAASKTEALRLIQNSGAYLNNERVDDPQFLIGEDHLVGGEYLLFGAGKKKKILVNIQK